MVIRHRAMQAEHKQERLNEAVNKILADFPPKASK